ncbi:MAG: restriction endonuclease subunit S [Methylococcales bacterium]|nr:restriction endonuclease subunit S [Methylococcales bacterium]
MKKYPEYKASGVEWLGDIPNDWSISRLKMFSKIYSGGTPDKNNKSYWENGSIPWIASGEVNQDIIKTPTTLITEEAFINSSAKWIPKNAIVIALAGQGKTKGTVAILDIEVTCNQSLAAIVIKNINYKYLFYWLKSKNLFKIYSN